MIFHLSIRKMTEYLDGQLAENQLLKTQTHLDNCTKCQKKMKILKISEKILQVPENPLDTLRNRILDNIIEVKWSVSSPVIGEIQSVIGLASVKSRKTREELEAFPGMVLRKDDILKTGNSSKVLIKWKDESEFYVNEKTEIDFSEPQYPISLQLGEIFAMMKPQRELFEIKTPSTVLAVVGTDFDTKVTGNRKTILQVVKGKVSFKSKTGDVLVKKINRQNHLNTLNLLSQKLKIYNRFKVGLSPSTRI